MQEAQALIARGCSTYQLLRGPARAHETVDQRQQKAQPDVTQLLCGFGVQIMGALEFVAEVRVRLERCTDAVAEKRPAQRYLEVADQPSDAALGGDGAGRILGDDRPVTITFGARHKDHITTAPATATASHAARFLLRQMTN